ncbi:MAG: M50 family metallopeptidase [Sporichthyaceae bacterium]
MLTLIGILLFVFLLMLSIAIHEFGHLLTAKAYGMKATEYFIGFGPKLWSFRRGETEYGFKAIPAGGYVKIVGMTDIEVVEEKDAHRAFYKFSCPKRLVVLSAGSISHMLIAIVLFFIVLVGFGRTVADTTVGNVSECVPAQGSTAPCGPNDPASPAKAAGLQKGDRVLAVGGTPIEKWADATRAIRANGAGPLDILVERNGQQVTVTPTLVTRERADLDDPSKKVAVGVIGVEPGYKTDRADPIGGAWDSVELIGTVVKASVEAMVNIPEKIPNLVESIGGGERDKEGLVGVVGAARVSGELLSLPDETLKDRVAMVLLNVAALNVFIGLFNALPLLPLDGGHMAVVSYETGRRRIFKKLGKADPGRVDMNKLLPLAYGFLVLVIGLTVLLVVADVVNPITIS